MRLLFWNMKKNPVGDLIKTCLREHEIDVAVFAEHEGVDLPALVRELDGRYRYVDPVQERPRIVAVTERGLRAILRREQSRYALYEIVCGGVRVVLGGIHLHDRWSRRDPVVRLETIHYDLVPDIEALERELGHDRTIVIGDFNAGPFDQELLQMNAFNAALFKDVILRDDVRTVDGKRYRRFYDPVLHFLSEDTKTYGSYYHSGDPCTPVWHCLDHVLVRRALADSIRDLQYLRRIGDTDLIKEVRPDPEISDHLPLFVDIDLTGGDDHGN